MSKAETDLVNFQNSTNMKLNQQSLHIEKINDKLTTLVDIKQFQELKTYTSGFVHIGAVDELRNLLVPKMETCLAAIEEYRGENQQMRECVLQMDAQMCNKVNKVTHIELVNKFEADSRYMHE